MTSLFKAKFGRGRNKSGAQSSKGSGTQQTSQEPELVEETPRAPSQDIESTHGPPQDKDVTSQESPVDIASHSAHDRTDDSFSMGPTVQISSIFTGLQLSNKVAKDEAPDSPYVQRKSVDTEEPQSTSFSFLHTSEEAANEVDSAGSGSQDTGSEGNRETSGLGFAFLHQLPSQPNDSNSCPSTSEDLLVPTLAHSSLPQSEQDQTDKAISTVPSVVATSSILLASSITLHTSTTDRQLLQQPHSHEPKISPHSSAAIHDNNQSSLKDQQVPHAPALAGKKQLPPKGNKKTKKRKAVRPGQNRETGETEQINAPEDSTQSSLQGHILPDHLTNNTPVDQSKDMVHEQNTSCEDLVTLATTNEVQMLSPATHGPSAQQHKEKDSTELEDVTTPAQTSAQEGHHSPPGALLLENSLPLSSLASAPAATTSPSNGQDTDSQDQPTEDGVYQGKEEISPEGVSPSDEACPEDVALDGACPEGVAPGGAFPEGAATCDGAYPEGVAPGDEACPEGVAPGESKLAGVLEVYSTGMLDLKCKLLSVIEQHRASVVHTQHQLQDQAKMWMESQTLRDREAQALANEDYELVEELRKKLEMTGKITERELAMSSMTEICSWILKVQEQCAGQVTFQKGMILQLEVMKEDHHNTLEKLRTSQASELSKEKLQLQSLSNEVEREAGHIALDRSHWEKRKQLVEEEANHRAATFIAKKEVLSSQLTQIEDEIKQLEAKLLCLRTERSGIIAAIATQDDQIETVNEEFSEEKQQLHVEDAALQEKENMLAQQQRTHSEQQTAMETMEKRHYLKREKIEDQMKQAIVVLNEIQASTSAQPLLTNHLQELQAVLQQGRDHFISSAELGICLETEKRKKEEVVKTTQDVLGGQAHLGATRKRLRDLQEKLVELQDSKKAAVTGRQFKEASRFASLVKSVSMEVTVEEENLAQAEEAIKLASDSLAQLSLELSACLEQVAQLERKEDEACIVAVLADLKTLQSKSSNIKTLESKFSSIDEANLPGAMEAWKKLYLSLAECLSARHGLNFSNMYSEGDTDVLEVRLSSDSAHSDPDTCDTTVLNSVQDPAQHDTIATIEGTQVTEIEERCKELEVAIEKACEEENYERAAELEEELVRLQGQKKE